MFQNVFHLHVFVCVSAVKNVFLYLSLVHGVITYVDNWSGVSLGGPCERDKEKDNVFSLALHEYHTV